MYLYVSCSCSSSLQDLYSVSQLRNFKAANISVPLIFPNVVMICVESGWPKVTSQFFMPKVWLDFTVS